MTEADLEAVLLAEKTLAAFPWTLGNFADAMMAGNDLWVALESATLVAYAVGSQVLDEAHLLTIGVLPGRQREGRGVQVMQHLFGVAKEQGGARMFLEVRPSNLPALALYRRTGFIEIGRRKGYYPAPDGREDAIVMARDL